MKNTKSVLTIILAMVIITSVFAACSAKTEETSVEDTNSENTTVSTTIESTTEQSSDTKAADTEDNESDEASSSNSGGSDSADSNSGNSKTTTKKQTTTKNQTTTKKQATTQKTTTTTKKATTTQKNVSAKEVQNEVNNYIKSKGITLDSSMTPGNASWSGQIAGTQEDLNNGYSLKTCKSYADLDISDYKSSNGCNPLAMYCYYDGSDFYILYW